jgi:solute carrier family 25 carnitine/acylcarnitine transporter 20/29
MYAEICAGLASGIAQTIIGHPFDTIKTLRQNKISTSVRNISVIQSFNGVGVSLIQCPPSVFISFVMNDYFYKYSNNSILSGMLSGLLCSIMLCPTQYIKVRQQTEKIQNKNITITNSLKYVLHSYKTLHSVLLREIPAMGIYFSTYKYLKDKDIPIFIAGASTGILTWTITYPLDTIKSRLQSGACTTLNQSYRQGKLYYGLNYCLMRALVVNGVTFTTYEHVHNYIKK